MENIVDRLNAKIAEKSLLNHPFYQAWQRGELTRTDLQNYAAQYYFFERDFPRFLSGIHASCPHLDVQKVILENLWDEQHGEEAHLNLWIDFVTTLSRSEGSLPLGKRYPETIQLLGEYSFVCMQGLFTEGIVEVYVYEKQVPEIAKVKMAGLKQFYGITDEKALKFFVVHSELDGTHSLREAEVLNRYLRPDNKYHVELVETAADRALSAWWNFLNGIEKRRLAKSS